MGQKPHLFLGMILASAELTNISAQRRRLFFFLIARSSQDVGNIKLLNINVGCFKRLHSDCSPFIDFINCYKQIDN